MKDFMESFSGMEKATMYAAGILAFGFMFAALIGGLTYYKVRSLSNTLVVTGSATATTTADVAKLRITVSRVAFDSTLGSAQTRVTTDAAAVSDYFKAKGIAEADIQISPAFVYQNYMKDESAPQSYNVQANISIQSDDPSLIDSLSKEVGVALANKGVNASVQQPEFYISNLPELRVALIGKAVADARDRAESIAESTGQKVGKLQSASSGVVQVMAPNSIDISDYGSYDTTTIDKQVMVTARATFQVR